MNTLNISGDLRDRGNGLNNQLRPIRSGMSELCFSFQQKLFESISFIGIGMRKNSLNLVSIFHTTDTDDIYHTEYLRSDDIVRKVRLAKRVGVLSIRYNAVQGYESFGVNE